MARDNHTSGQTFLRFGQSGLPPSDFHVEQIQKEYHQPNHGFSAVQILCLSGSHTDAQGNVWFKPAIVDGTSNQYAVGVISEIITKHDFLMVHSGLVWNPSGGMGDNGRRWLNDTTAGAMCASPQTAVVIGDVINDQTILVNINGGTATPIMRLKITAGQTIGTSPNTISAIEYTTTPISAASVNGAPTQNDINVNTTFSPNGIGSAILEINGVPSLDRVLVINNNALSPTMKFAGSIVPTINSYMISGSISGSYRVYQPYVE